MVHFAVRRRQVTLSIVAQQLAIFESVVCMNEQHIRWDDLCLVLAVQRFGSLSGAGRNLAVSHATVFRRLTGLERRLGVRLFERSASGYTATPAGELLSVTAERIEEEVFRAERYVIGQDLRPAGSVRVTTTDTLLAGLLTPILFDFHRQYPGIELELAVSHQLFNLSKREADVALRPTPRPQHTLVGRKVGEIAQAAYVSTQHPFAAQPDAELSSFEWIGPDVTLSYTLLDTWMASHGLHRNVSYRVDTLLGMRDAAAAGFGVAALPCYLGDQDTQLIRVGQPIADLEVDLWLLTHPDLKDVARIRVFVDFVADAIETRRNLLLGAA